MSERSVFLTIEGIPPSVNHYKKEVWKKAKGGVRHKTFEWTAEAILFRDRIMVAAAGRTIAPEGQRERDKVRYQLSVKVCLGRKQRGDGDNFWKVIADCLEDVGVIHSDARVSRWVMEVDDTDRGNPRTEIAAEVLDVKAVRAQDAGHINTIANTLCEHLPEGWTVNLECEQGAGSFALYRERGAGDFAAVEFDEWADVDMNLEQQAEAALKYAKEHTAVRA